MFFFAFGAKSETVFEFSSAADMSQTKNGISVLLAKGSGQTAPDYKISTYNNETHEDMRLYLGNTITLSSDQSLTNIQMVFARSNASNKEYAGLEVSSGVLVSGGVAEDNMDWKVDSWTGEATQVVFTLTGKGQRQIQKIVIDGEPVVIEPTVPSPLPTEADLEPDYTYAEPAIVSVPDTTVEKKEYAFIDHNILVHCDMGSIIKATDTTEAYFNCNAGYTITFTAVRPIRSLAIDGYVRKNFSATSDAGELWYMTNEDIELEGWPVLTITDLNATSVTLSCPKQIRCYSVRLFFEEKQAIDNTNIEETRIDFTAPMYNILGGKVNPKDKGIVLQNGHKYLLP